MAPEDTRTDSDSWRGSHLVCNGATPRRLPRNEMEDGWRRAPGLERSLFLSGVYIDRTCGTWKPIECQWVSKLNRSRAGRRCLRPLELIPLNLVFRLEFTSPFGSRLLPLRICNLIVGVTGPHMSYSNIPISMDPQWIRDNELD